MNIQENYGDKVFNQDLAQEMYRLSLVSKTYDFISQYQLKSLNLQPDTRCLDIGAGSGSLAAWLAHQPELKNGEVVAIDRHIHLLTEMFSGRKKNFKIIKYDIITDNYPIGQFDLVNVRFVLMHLRERADLIKKIASWVKPGGWLVVSDIVDPMTEQATHPAYRQVMSTMWDVLISTIGTDRNWSLTKFPFRRTKI